MSRVNSIIEKLKENKEGILVTDLFGLHETDNSVNQIAHRVREELGGKERLVVKNGTWTLNEYGFTITQAERNQNKILTNQMRIEKKLTWFMWGVIIFVVATILTVTTSILLLFDIDITLYA